MAKIKHSKYRNTGFLFEMLVRQVTVDILNSKKNSAAESLLGEYFNTKTELGKEFKLYQLLLTQKYKSEYRADKFVDIVAEARLTLDDNKITKLKYNLIKDIKESFDIDSFFAHPINNYRTIASIYKLFESKIDSDINDVMTIKNTIVENIIGDTGSLVDTTKKDKLIESYRREGRDLKILVTKIMVEKFNDKYKSLNEKQKFIIKEYINNISDNKKLREFIKEELPKIIKKLKSLSEKIEDKVTVIKLKETIEQLKHIPATDRVKDGQFTSILLSFELIKELEDKIREI